MIQFSNIDHLNLNVKNLKKDQEFYKKMFAMKEFERGKSGSGNPYVIIGSPGKLFLCLYENPSVAGKGAMNHFGIHIDNFDQVVEKLQRSGVPLLYGGGVVEYPNSRSVYIADPSGNEIELSEKFGGDLS
jgi:lactoylglutathione lyase